MNAILCKICIKPFNSTAPPRMLVPCGHSCCSACIGQILKTTKHCPFCRKSLSNSKLQDFPVNYSLLEVCEEMTDSQCSASFVKKRLQLIHEKHKRILKFAEAAILTAEKHKPDVNIMRKNQTKLNNFVTTYDDAINVKEANAALDGFVNSMNKVAKVFAWTENSEIVFDLQLRGSQFQYHDDYLREVYKQISDGKTVMAYKLINGENQFARISIRDMSLFVHAFSSSTKDSEAMVVEYEDILEVYFHGYPDLETFLDISSASGLCKRLFINCTRHICSPLLRPFIRFCTGETGFSYASGVASKLFRSQNGFKVCRPDISKTFFKDQDSYITLLFERFVDKHFAKCERAKDTYYVTFEKCNGNLLLGSNECEWSVVGSCSAEDINLVVKSFGEDEATTDVSFDSRLTKIRDCGIVLRLEI